MGQRKSVACGFGLKFQYTEKDYLGRIPVTEVLVVFGFALAVYNVKKSKEYEKVAKVGCNISMVCAVANSCFLLINGKMSIFCILGLVASVLIIAGVVKE